MYDFAYHRPKTLAEATAALKGKPEARAMSGGMTLIPTLKQRLAKPTDVVDLNGIKDLAGIKVDGSGRDDRRHDPPRRRRLARPTSRRRSRRWPISPATSAIRRCATAARMGGSVANNDPAADYPAAVLALNATVTTNSRKITADDFFKGLFETALEDGELITCISFPKADKAGYMKFPNPASRYAMVGVFVAKTGNGVRVAVTGAGPCVFRVKAMEDALAKNFSSDAIKDIKVPADGLNSDIHGSAEYRAHLVNVMARRAVDQANK